MSKISAPISDFEKNDYYQLVKQAIGIWNNCGIFNFVLQDFPQNANIVINWTKVGTVFEGMCKYRSIVASEIKSVTIDIGLPNKFSQKIVDNSTILHSILHELGHAVGLGHGVDENDVMFVPHKKTLKNLSENDLFVLKKLYSVPIGSDLNKILQ